MIFRKAYIDKIAPFIDKPFVKVITGLRRSGKSTILLLLKEEIIKRGAKAQNVLYINFESFDFANLDSADKLYLYVKQKISNPDKHYILLDEIQEVASWEKAVDAFRVDFNADIYITGSNSRLLSSELATYLAGRYVEIPVYTLSFEESDQFGKAFAREAESDIFKKFNRYLRLGGFPVIHTADYGPDASYKIIYDIYSSAILRDTVQRYNIRDVELLERVVKFVFDNLGNNFSGKNVADYFKSQQRRIDLNTVYNYLSALESAFILYRIPRYDVKGKEILKTMEKYYLGDHSLLYAVMGNKDRLIAGVLENMVMLELKRRGYQVFVGKLQDREIDFIAEKQSDRVYVQVAYRMEGEKTIEREFRPLLDIRDNHPKYVVSMDETWKDNIEGIRHMHIAEFLLMKEYGSGKQ
jgi:predicted AAA+ superfamily ATPase